MLERSRLGGAIYNFSDRSGGDAHDRAALKALTEPFFASGITDMRNGLKADQAAAALIFRVVHTFNEKRFLKKLAEENFDAFSALAKVYVTCFGEASRDPSYFAHAASFFDHHAHNDLQQMVLNAPSR